MFEFNIIKRYLLPRRKQLSLSLVGLMSVFVISLVVWLLILFLSVTEGIETTWLKRLTALNGPVRIIPTEAYYNSYYYQVDSLSSNSNYTYKSIRDKLLSKDSDPYNPDFDETLPIYLPEKLENEKGQALDLVKDLFATLSSLQDQQKISHFQEYETAGCMLKLGLLRQTGPFNNNLDQTFISQASYVTSLAESSSAFHDLIMSPRPTDLNNLLFLSSFGENHTQEDAPMPNKTGPDKTGQTSTEKAKVRAILSNIDLKAVTLFSNCFNLPHESIKGSLTAYANIRFDSLSHIIIASSKKSAFSTGSLERGTLYREGESIYFETAEKRYTVEHYTPITLLEDKVADASIIENSLLSADTLSDVLLSLSFSLQGELFSFSAPFQDVEIADVRVKTTFSSPPPVPPPWAYQVNGICYLPSGGILLPKNMQDSHICLGDTGHLAYSAPTNTMVQEQRIKASVAGFYDPGVMAVGARSIITDYDTVHTISSASKNLALDELMASGVQVWLKNLKKAKTITEEIESALEKQGLSEFWRVVPFYEYDFAKDLMTQFQSDRYLFMLVGVIILTVACCNILSLLLLLVNDKRYEIGVMLSLGARRRSLAVIFGSIGALIGMLSALLGSLFAYLTLKNLDSLVHFLNVLEGQQAFNAAFYGESLPSKLSSASLLFILITTPILSIFAGLVPARKACKICPYTILRSQ